MFYCWCRGLDQPRSVIDHQGLARAARDGRLDGGAQLLGRLFLQEHQLVVLVGPEHRWRFLHTPSVPLTPIEVDQDLHRPDIRRMLASSSRDSSLMISATGRTWFMRPTICPT